MTRLRLALAVLLAAAGASAAPMGRAPVSGEINPAGASASASAAFSAHVGGMITVLSGVGMTPMSGITPAAVNARTLAVQAAVQSARFVAAAPELRAPAAKALLDFVTAGPTASPAFVPLKDQVDAPTYERAVELRRTLRERPETVQILRGLFEKARGEAAFDRALLDAAFDGSKAAPEDKGAVAGSEGVADHNLLKPATPRAHDGPIGKVSVPQPEKVDEHGSSSVDGRALRKAGLQVLGWVAAAMAFGWFGIHHFLGAAAFSEYLATYAVEWSMSLDNLVVISSLLMALPESIRPNVLRWGLIGTIVARLAMVTGGVSLVASVHGIFLAFGAFLIATALKMAVDAGMLSSKWDLLGHIGNLFKKLTPPGVERFGERLAAALPAWLKTPFVAGLAGVIGLGVIFALDSVPASLAISKSWLVIFSANAFSVMGLGALFSVIEWLEKQFKYLPVGVAGVLAFVGAKMIAEPLLGLTVGSFASLGVIFALLGGSMVLPALLKPFSRR